MVTALKYLVTRALEAATQIRPTEIRATLTAFATVFLLMASYFIMRPVRDAMASDWSDTEVSLLWNLQFFISAAIISVYGVMVSRMKFKRVVPCVYFLFSVTFLGFYLVSPKLDNVILVEKAFYLWVSAFSLLHLSVFWSLMSTLFSKHQGKRLFSVIAAGSSAGAIVGPLVPAFFSRTLGLDSLMLIAALGLILVVPLVLYLIQLQSAAPNSPRHHRVISNRPVGGRWWAGFNQVVSNRYLLGIAAFILLYVFVSSFIYFEQKNLLAPYSRPERVQILSTIDGVVNTLTFVIAFFVTGRLVTKIGMPFTLMCMPLLLALGLAAIAFAPLVVLVMALQITRRTGNYALTRPAREMLFTQVTTEERLKAKPVIDVVIYRGGDAASGTLFALLSDGVGLSMGVIAGIGAGICALWVVIAQKLGLHYERTHIQDPPTAHLKPKPATPKHLVTSKN